MVKRGIHRHQQITSKIINYQNRMQTKERKIARQFEKECKRNLLKNLLENLLGKEIEKVTITNEGDSIIVAPKGWIKKQIWREINYILRLQKFSWLSNGKDSCWFRLIS